MVTKSQLCDAYASLATWVEQESMVVLCALVAWRDALTRKHPHTQSIDRSMSCLALCKPMVSGSKHKWATELMTAGESTWMGLADSSGVIERERSLGSQQLGWVHGENGSKMYAGT